MSPPVTTGDPRPPSECDRAWRSKRASRWLRLATSISGGRDAGPGADYSLGMAGTTLHRGKVLLVDDEAAMGDYLVEGLAGAGFGAAAVHSGEQALAHLASHEFDV